MSALQDLNPRAEVMGQQSALNMNISAGKSLGDVMKGSLGPSGTQKMLVSGAGELKLTKDGAVLLKEMHIISPIAQLIGQTAIAQDDITGDGTTSVILLIASMLSESERFIRDGVHPRVLVHGLEKAADLAVKFLDETAIDKPITKELLLDVAYTALNTKLRPAMARKFAEYCVEAVLTVRKKKEEVIEEGKPTVYPTLKFSELDLNMVEVLAMQHRSDTHTKLIKGLVLDHGLKHSEMPTDMHNVHILCCNILLEYEKTESESVMEYKNADERAELVRGETDVVDARCMQIVKLKEAVCKPGESFFVVNQDGIDLRSNEILAKHGISAVRRAKRRNMERVTRACGGFAMASAQDLISADGVPNVSCLGHADHVFVEVIGEDHFTFIEGVKDPFSCTVLLKGANKHTIFLLKDALRDGLTSVRNMLVSSKVVPGGGAFEIACSKHIHDMIRSSSTAISGRAQLGATVFADSLLVIPKILAQNSGYDPHETFVELSRKPGCGVMIGGKESVRTYVEEKKEGELISLEQEVNPHTVSAPVIDAKEAGILDGYRVKFNMLKNTAAIVGQILLVDSIIKGGRQIRKNADAAME
ncbi:T-complex protein 1 subunit zeta [Aduncisulcus paluster]|uniref:T-complex protein 1 subunit zeta n=1 Tax=Aduncisulcus paluster TaxID=2918883 RepID=A0ABQ5K6H7_9EUKA|nr:T-complex protein 1 subunit zeta [Aduncisulcus paluster]|eukprot:gnl/Carplike_NY0171/2370_a3192_791.p1 GENE.gnl/Carplike_NY0171/2370_a3192_791~~gnl/Carplike_NY0171/2370_a3192_791.p1  ORF type:complete len:589 (+),score=190.91 gnl/Carplike_NY0171/2370_a3192_791:14-1780(+)